MTRRTLLALTGTGLLGLAAVSCTVVYHDPPYGPANGYVVVHGGADLVFDSGLGVYVVTGHPDYYFFHGFYYRVLPGERFERCRTLTGYWRSVRVSTVPPGIARRYWVHSQERRFEEPRGRGRGKYDH